MYFSITYFYLQKIKPMLEDWTKKIHYNVDEQQVRDFYSNLDSLLAAEMLIDEKLNDSIQKGKINDTDNILQSSTIGSTLYKLVKYIFVCSKFQELNFFLYKLVINELYLKLYNKSLNSFQIVLIRYNFTERTIKSLSRFY